MKKVIILANCQARPIAKYITELSEECEVIEIGIVHLLNDEQKEYFHKKFDEADFIVAQQVSSNYPCQFVTTKSLLEKYSSKVISIVNLYFSGYNPELRYVRIPGQGTLKGPLGDYHIETFIDCWKKGLSVADTVQLYNNIDYHNKIYKNSIDNSLKELRKREAETELNISDYIQENLSKKKLFHTMNHPSEALLVKYSEMILERIGVDYKKSQPDVSMKESLGVFRLPTNPYITTLISDNMQNTDLFKGVKIEVDTDGDVKIIKNSEYDLEGIIRAFYEVYNSNRNIINSI